MTTDFLELETLIPSYKKMIGSESFDSDVYGNIPENDLLEWGHAALGRIHTAAQKVHKIAIIPVNEYRAKLPKGFLLVVQAAYRIEPSKPSFREQVSQWTENLLEGCKLEIDLICPSCKKNDCNCDTQVVEVDVNRIYKEAHPEYYYGYLKHFYAYGNTFSRNEKGCVYSDEFKLMRRTMDGMTRIPYHIGNCVNIQVDSPIEYEIHPVGTELQISTTFKKGEILLSYISEKTGRDGYRMVPNTEAAIQAVLTSIDERVAYRQWRRSRSPQDRVDWQTINQLREDQIGRAVAELKIPDKDRWVNFLDTQWKQPLPFWHYDPQRNLHNPNLRDPGDYWGGVRKDYNFGY